MQSKQSFVNLPRSVCTLGLSDTMCVIAQSKYHRNAKMKLAKILMRLSATDVTPAVSLEDVDWGGGWVNPRVKTGKPCLGLAVKSSWVGHFPCFR